MRAARHAYQAAKQEFNNKKIELESMMTQRDAIEKQLTVFQQRGAEFNDLKNSNEKLVTIQGKINVGKTRLNVLKEKMEQLEMDNNEINTQALAAKHAKDSLQRFQRNQRRF
jgi:chaperonin cofactor prefoldin